MLGGNILSVQIFALLMAFVLCLIGGPVLIPVLRRLKFGQIVRNDGPGAHLRKTGTPTMGGIIFLIALIITSVFFAGKYPGIIPLLLVTICFGIIGFVDDFIMVVLKRSLGLRANQKMVGLIVIAAIFSAYLKYYTDVGTKINIPFTGRYFDLAWAFIPFTIFVFVSATNSVNLTDGLDGLAAGVTLIVMVFFTIAAMASHQHEYVVIFSAAMAGCCLGFLVFNSHPAKVFMGDTGSLALGGAVAAIAVMLRMPLIIVIVGGIYVAETLSVVIQVVSFKTRGKRVFKMAPIHHHFELSGWKETRVAATFWIATIVLCLVGFVSLRLI